MLAVPGKTRQGLEAGHKPPPPRPPPPQSVLLLYGVCPWSCMFLRLFPKGSTGCKPKRLQRWQGPLPIRFCDFICQELCSG